MIFGKLRRSFSAKLSFFILLFAAAIFVAAFMVFYRFCSRTIEREARTEAENTLRTINLQIEKVLRRIEAVPDNLTWIITGGHMPPDSMYSITRNVIRNNTDIYGSAIAFEPYYFEEKGYYFSPYSYRSGDSIPSLQLGNQDYDYFAREWYSEPKKLGRSCWSEPYYDEGGGQMVMCTYSAPIHDRNGEMIGIFTSDISLVWLTDMIDSMKRSDLSYTFMLGKDGTYIVHYLRERILNQTIFGSAEAMNDPNVRLLGENMIAGKQDMQLMDNNGVMSFVFYAPVPHTQWSLGIVLPVKEVFADLHRTNLLLLLVVGLGLLILSLICSRIIRQLTKPLKIFAASTREIARGDFHARLPAIRSKDEMKELYDAFSYMQSELTNYIADLQRTTSAKERMESELRIARDIQMSMIPKIFPPFPACKEIDLYAVINPAKEVGGDLYDFFMKDGVLYFAVGDVSGHGIPASLLMAVTLTLFRSIAMRAETLADAMNAINASIAENNESNIFVTLFIGALDLKTGLLACCNAGHNPPVVIRPDGSCAWLEIAPNLPVGVIKQFSYKEQSLALPDAGALMLYTDGVTEAENAEKQLYGKERLLRVIQKNFKQTPCNMIETLLSDINDYVKDNEPSDDITLLAIQYRGNTEPVITNSSTLLISNKIEELTKLTSFIEQAGEQMNLPREWFMKLNLAIEEAISNIIFYGYDNRKGEIAIVFSRIDDKLVITITDDGIAFDPTVAANPDVTLSVEKCRVGGLGIFLIKQIMNGIAYRRENGKNILIMTKHININK